MNTGDKVRTKIHILKNLMVSKLHGMPAGPGDVGGFVGLGRIATAEIDSIRLKMSLNDNFNVDSYRFSICQHLRPPTRLLRCYRFWNWDVSGSPKSVPIIGTYCDRQN